MFQSFCHRVKLAEFQSVILRLIDGSSAAGVATSRPVCWWWRRESLLVERRTSTKDLRGRRLHSEEGHSRGGVGSWIRQVGGVVAGDRSYHAVVVYDDGGHGEQFLLI